MLCRLEESLLKQKELGKQLKQPQLNITQSSKAFSGSELQKAKSLAAMVVCGDVRPLSCMEKDSWMSKLMAHLSNGRISSYTHSTLMTETLDLEIKVKMGKDLFSL